MSEGRVFLAADKETAWISLGNSRFPLFSINSAAGATGGFPPVLVQCCADKVLEFLKG
jgi:hypothetical protein